MQYTVRRLDEEEISHIYKTYMKKDFPPAELKPLGHIIRSMERGYGFRGSSWWDTPCSLLLPAVRCWIILPL